MKERVLAKVKATSVSCVPSHLPPRRHRARRPRHLQMPLHPRSLALAFPSLHQNNQELARECPKEQRPVDFIFPGPAVAPAPTS